MAQKWTEKRWFGFLRSSLRRASLKYPPRYEAMNVGKRVYKGTDKRRKWDHQCSKCKKWLKGSEVQLDHVIPCGELTKTSHIKGFVMRLFCESDGFQKMCKPCHLKKTEKEK